MAKEKAATQPAENATENITVVTPVTDTISIADLPVAAVSGAIDAVKEAGKREYAKKPYQEWRVEIGKSPLPEGQEPKPDQFLKKTRVVKMEPWRIELLNQQAHNSNLYYKLITE